MVLFQVHLFPFRYNTQGFTNSFLAVHLCEPFLDLCHHLLVARELLFSSRTFASGALLKNFSLESIPLERASSLTRRSFFLLRGVPSPSQNRPDPQAADTVLLPELRQIPHRPRFRSCLPVHSHRLRLPDSDMPLSCLLKCLTQCGIVCHNENLCFS